VKQNTRLRQFTGSAQSEKKCGHALPLPCRRASVALCAIYLMLEWLFIAKNNKRIKEQLIRREGHMVTTGDMTRKRTTYCVQWQWSPCGRHPPLHHLWTIGDPLDWMPCSIECFFSPSVLCQQYLQGQKAMAGWVAERRHTGLTDKFNSERWIRFDLLTSCHHRHNNKLAKSLQFGSVAANGSSKILEGILHQELPS